MKPTILVMNSYQSRMPFNFVPQVGIVHCFDVVEAEGVTLTSGVSVDTRPLVVHSARVHKEEA